MSGFVTAQVLSGNFIVFSSEGPCASLGVLVRTYLTIALWQFFLRKTLKKFESRGLVVSFPYEVVVSLE